MQVYPLAQRYMDNPQELDGMWVYDDEFVKGMIHISKLSSKRVEKVEDVLNLGDDVVVECIKIDEKNRCDFKLISKK